MTPIRPHHDLDAERAVIGCAMLDAITVDEVELKPPDFYSPQNAAVWGGVLRLRRASTPIDLITLRDDLTEMGDLERAGGEERLVELANDVPNVDHASAYAETVRRHATVRRIIAGCREVQLSANDPVLDPEAFIDAAEAKLGQVFTGSRSGATVEHVRDIVIRVAENLAERDEQKHATGLRTGFPTLDRLLGGLEGGQLIILAGRPGMGKSALAQDIVLEAAEQYGPALFFSLEMSRELLLRRIACSAGSVDSQRAKTGEMTATDWGRMTTALERLSKLPLYVDDTPGLTPFQARGRARRVKARHGLALVVADYLQLMRWHERTQSREASMAEISRSLKELAKELDVPVLALSQLNREVEKRPDKRPRLSDLRESGAIEQDADVVLFVYREAFYDPVKADPRGAEIIVAKQRSGSMGTAKVTWRGEYTRFEPFVSGDFDEEQRRIGGGFS